MASSSASAAIGAVEAELVSLGTQSEEAEMNIVGCDFHTRFQQIAMLNTETGKRLERRLYHWVLGWIALSC